MMKKLAQRHFLFWFICSVSGAALSADPVIKEYSLNLTRPGEAVNLEVEVRYGSIRIEGYQGKTVEIQASFSELDDRPEKSPTPPKPVIYWQDENTAKPRPSDGLKRIPNNRIHLDIEEKNNHVEIGSDLYNRKIDLLIKLPVNSDIQAGIHDYGDINIRNITGTLELSNHRGGITAMEIDGPIVAETHLMDIVIGFKNYDNKHPSSFSSHNGNIDITIPEKSAEMNLVVNSYRGEILSGLDAKFVANDEINSRREGHQEITIGGSMSAKLNGGGQTVSAQTYNGNIYIRKQ